MNTRLSYPQGSCPLGESKNHVFILNILDVILMYIVDVILMHILDVLIRMHISDVLLLPPLAATVIAPLFWDFQRCTTLLKHMYAISIALESH